MLDLQERIFLPEMGRISARAASSVHAITPAAASRGQFAGAAAGYNGAYHSPSARRPRVIDSSAFRFFEQ